MRDSINLSLKAALVGLTVILAISSVLLYVQISSYKDPSIPDTDGDGFFDGDEWSWQTSLRDRNDNPVTARILPLAMATIIVVVILILGKYRRWKRVPELAPALFKLVGAMRAAIRNGNRVDIASCKSDFDGAIMEIRGGSHHDMLKEPEIQDILVEFEVLCIDAFVDGSELG